MYDNLTEIKSRKVDGIAPWVVVKNDNSLRIICEDWENGIKRIILSLCQQHRSIIQAGGHQGLYPRLLAEMFDKVYTFEPHPINFHCLVNNCQKDNIVKFQAALGEKPDLISNTLESRYYNRPEERELNSGMNKTSKGIFSYIPQITIDSFAFKDIDLIYLDVEGNELNALKGAKNVLLEHSPVVGIENAVPEIVGYLYHLGYTFKIKHNMDSFFEKKN
jgi:FkbM family methyltransferase